MILSLKKIASTSVRMPSIRVAACFVCAGYGIPVHVSISLAVAEDMFRGKPIVSQTEINVDFLRRLVKPNSR